MRNQWIIASLFLGAILGAVLTTPAAAEPRSRQESGVQLGAADDAFWGERRKGWRSDDRRIKRRRHRPPIVFPYYPDYGDRYRRREEVAVEPEAAPVPPVVEAPAEPAPPPDPRGPLHLSAARGVAPAPVPYSVGEPLPAGLPHVTLDWRRYDLPEPPAGRLYARVGRDVLLITATGRVVERVLPPG